MSTTVYSRCLLRGRNGERDTSSILFIDRKSKKGKIFYFDDITRPYAFPEVVVVSGEIWIPKDGVYYSPIPRSGNFSFYFPGADELVKTKLDPEMRIVYANDTAAFFAKGKDLYRMPISRRGCGEPAKFLTLDFEAFMMFPVPEKTP